jgi:hypothetical protein
MKRPKLDVGFTGTREGMTRKQFRKFCTIIRTTPMKSFHQGCCIGADTQACIAMYDYRPKVRMFGHPPTDTRYMDMMNPEFCDTLMDPLPYHERNKAIVRASTLMIATPLASTYYQSGTWHAIDFSIRKHTPVLLIDPEGTTMYL